MHCVPQPARLAPPGPRLDLAGSTTDCVRGDAAQAASSFDHAPVMHGEIEQRGYVVPRKDVDAATAQGILHDQVQGASSIAGPDVCAGQVRRRERNDTPRCGKVVG